MIRVLLTFAAVALLASFYYAQPTPDDRIAGHVFVVDGDSLDVFNRRIVLFGIDAPEGEQTCRDAEGAEYKCGEIAANALTDLIGNLPVRCEPIERDHNDRDVARCFLGDHDLASWMVASGHALAYREFTTDYIDEEDVARNMKRGMWQGEFEPPWEWRRKGN